MLAGYGLSASEWCIKINGTSRLTTVNIALHPVDNYSNYCIKKAYAAEKKVATK